jgi:hypothetical protein
VHLPAGPFIVAKKEAASDGNPVTFAGFCDTLMTTESKQELLKGEG